MTNYNQVIGPTVFHFFFPLPKWCVKEDFVEKTALLQKTKQYHGFSIHNYLKSIDSPGLKENWEEQLKSMDPNYFLELSYKNYADKKIVG